jgi:hypothetical protein
MATKNLRMNGVMKIMEYEKKFEMLKNNLLSCLTYAKITPLCAKTFYHMAEGYVMGACMMATCDNNCEAHEELEKLWREVMDPAFQAIINK